MRSIAVINQKGGCGKTTISINLAACLAAQGQRTILIDMDPQSHCAVGLAVPEDQIERNIYDVLIARYAESPVTLKSIVWQISQNFDLAPSSIDLAALEPQLAGKEDRENCLKFILEHQAQHYDFVIIDCPPSVGLLTFNALRAADEVLIPVETGYFALHGLSRQLETLDVLRQQCDQQIQFKVIPSMYDVRTKLGREILGEIKKNYDARMCKTVINFNTKLKEAASYGQPITEYDPASKGMKDFIALAKEFIAEMKDLPQNTSVSTAQEPAPTRLVPQTPAVKSRESEPIPAEPSDHELKTIHEQLQKMSEQAQEIIAEAHNLGGAAPKIPQEATSEEKIEMFYGIRQKNGKVQFSVMYPKAAKVKIAGDFNNWQPEQTSLEKIDKSGRWLVELPLSQGVYRYRYVVDDQWQQDPYNSWVESNPFGDYNSVLEVK